MKRIVISYDPPTTASPEERSRRRDLFERMYSSDPVVAGLALKEVEATDKKRSHAARANLRIVTNNRSEDR